MRVMAKTKAFSHSTAHSFTCSEEGSYTEPVSFHLKSTQEGYATSSAIFVTTIFIALLVAVFTGVIHVLMIHVAVV